MWFISSVLYLGPGAKIILGARSDGLELGALVLQRPNVSGGWREHLDGVHFSTQHYWGLWGQTAWKVGFRCLALRLPDRPLISEP